MTDLVSVIDEIIVLHRERMFAMEQRKRADLALGSLLRTSLGWIRSDHLDGAEKAEREAANVSARERAEEVVALVERSMRGKICGECGARTTGGTVDAVPPVYLDITEASILARAPFDKIEARRTKQLENLGQQLPVWPWAEPIRGFGPLGLATIVAEAGRDISEYRSPAALWSRMGVGIKDGVRQGGLSKTAPKEQWIEHGYSAKRRSRMWNVGHALVLGNGDGEYRRAYLARKEYERQKAEAEGLIVAPAGKIPKGRSAEYRSVGHIDRRAQRYMEKMLLRDLWVEWRRATKTGAEPILDSSPALGPEDIAA